MVLVVGGAGGDGSGGAMLIISKNGDADVESGEGLGGRGNVVGVG